MTVRAQEKFRHRVKLWLLTKDLTVTELALKIGRRRDTVSRAINQDRFPRVRSRIEELIAS